MIRPGTEQDAPAAAELHAALVTEGFLPTLGAGFLRRLYLRIVRFDGSVLHVADDGGRIVGMAAGTTDVGALYRSFLVHDGVIAAALAAPRVLRSIPRVWETLRYGTSDDHGGLPAAEVLAVAVDGSARGRGLGRALVSATLDSLEARDVAAVRVVAGGGNDAALSLYRSCGFETKATIEVHRGTPSEVLVWQR